MKKIFLSVLVLSLLSTTACDNDDDGGSNDPIDQLPEATQTGENTFGCLINGEPFVVSNTNNQVAIYQGGGLSIGAEKSINQFFSEISMFISESALGEEISENEMYILNNDTNMKGQYYKEDENCFYFTSSSNTGFIKINNLDTTNFIISGEFEFQALSNNCQGIINITNGRFDLQYIP